MQDYHYPPNYRSMRLNGNIKGRERLSLAIKLLKMQILATETCFHWAILSHLRYFIITVFCYPGVSRRLYSKKPQRTITGIPPLKATVQPSLLQGGKRQPVKRLMVEHFITPPSIQHRGRTPYPHYS